MSVQIYQRYDLSSLLFIYYLQYYYHYNYYRKGGLTQESRVYLKIFNRADKSENFPLRGVHSCLKSRILRKCLPFEWPTIYDLLFIDTSVNFDVCHRLFQRRVSVILLSTRCVSMRPTTKSTPTASNTTSRWAAVVNRKGKRHTVFLVNKKGTTDDRTAIQSVGFVNDRALDQSEHE